MTFHWYIPFIAALVPVLIGFIWYNPKVFGNAWMNASGMTPEKAKEANMALIFFMSYVLALLVALSLISLTIHQISIFSVFANEPSAKDPNSEIGKYIADFFNNYGNNFRTFKHGALHGTIAGILIALPIIGTSAMFERRGLKYIAISGGYWIISMAIMGGIICAWL